MLALHESNYGASGNHRAYRNDCSLVCRAGNVLLSLSLDYYKELYLSQELILVRREAKLLQLTT